MLDAFRETHAERLIKAQKLSGRAIGRATTVSRGTIASMIRGERPLDHSRRHEFEVVRPVPTGQGPPVRCPDCGGLVLMPCGACRVRRLLAAGMLPKTYPDVAGQEDPLTIALQDEDEERYLKLRHEKERRMFAEMLAEPRAEDEPLDDLEPTDEELAEVDSG